MLMSILIGAAIGALIGAAIIGICECLKCAAEIFNSGPNTTKVEIIKKDSKVLQDVFEKHPRVRAAMRGEPTAVVLLYNKGKITSVGSVSGTLSSDFDNCSGYRISRTNREQAIAI